jgi:prophage tail gpP-like protein
MVVRVIDAPSPPDLSGPPLPVDDTPVPTIESRFPVSEQAILDVRGQLFTDWESIWLQDGWNESFAYFRFIAAERMPLPADWTLLQFKPGDECTIWLAGQKCLTGYITDRQVSYDKQRHQVQLIGKTRTHWGYKSSVDTPTGSFDGQTLSQVFLTVMAPYPGQPKIIGTVNPIPFEKLQNELGELTWDFLERIARPRGANLGSDRDGNYLLIGDHTFGVTAELKESINIKACECLISQDYFMMLFELRGQTAGSDENSGSATNEMKCIVNSKATLYSKLITPAEQPVATQGELCDRAYNEAKWHEGTEITANIVVYGWTYDGKHLWAPGADVYVDSPMAMLNMILKIRRVTFEQNDNTGTQTTLELVAPWMLNDHIFNVGPGVPPAPTANPQGTPPPSPEK